MGKKNCLLDGALSADEALSGRHDFETSDNYDDRTQNEEVGDDTENDAPFVHCYTASLYGTVQAALEASHRGRMSPRKNRTWR